MEKQFKKTLVLLVFVIIISFLGFSKSVFATNQFLFSADDGSNFVEVSSSDTNYPTLITSSSSITLRIEPIENIGPNQVLEKQSNSPQWSGVQPINNNGGFWGISLSSGSYYFTALIGQAPGGLATAVATINVVRPTMTAVSSCSPQLQVNLDWTDIPGAVCYNVTRSGLGFLTQACTSSFTDNTVSPNTSYTYTSIAVYGSGAPIPNTDASASVTTGSCGSLCGNSITNSGEQCDAGSQNGVACTPSYGSSCTYCSNSTSPGGGIPQCRNVTMQGDFCGNGIITSPETCDDADANSGDGCSSSCAIEPGWTCTGQPSVCTPITGQCTFSSASWSTSTAVEGEIVGLNVVGSNCNGQFVNYSINEADCVPLIGCSYTPITSFSGTFPSTNWATQWNFDNGGANSNPEYVFTARLSSNSSVTASSGDLVVTQAVPPPLCGNGAITSGETCDDGDTSSGDGCSSTCQTESGWTCNGQPSVCTLNPPVCGNGVCNAGENSTSCPQDCPAPACQITASSWSATQRTEGQSVNLNVQGTNCNGQSVSFIVWEYDTTSGDDPVSVNPASVLFSGNSATGIWVSEWQNDGPLGGDPEYYFISNVVGSSLSSGTSSGQLLNVNQSASVSQCGNIATCGNYPDSISCNNDACDVAENSVPNGVDCNDPNVACSCLWNVSTSACDAHVGGIAGSCAYTQQTTDDCSDGFLTFSWTAQWTWLPGKSPADDPDGIYLTCVSGSAVHECPAQIALPFFSFYNLIVAVIVIGLVYWVLAMRKSGRKHTRRKS